MPIDIPEATAPTTRRTFLTRAAVGGAVVTAGTVAGLGNLLPAGARTGQARGATISNAEFAAFATSLELAAVQAYQAALDGELLDAEWQQSAQGFQSNHQAVVDTLAGFLDTEAPAPVPDAEIMDGTTATVAEATDQTAVLTALAELEDTLAATHLSLVGSLDDTSTARTVAQVLAVESQQAVVLGRATGADLASLTPAEASTDNARTLETGTK